MTRSFKIWVGIFGITLLCLCLGRWFDRHCRGGCTKEFIVLNFEQSNRFFSFEDAQRTQLKNEKTRIMTPQLLTLETANEQLLQIHIKSYTSNWIVHRKAGLTDVELSFIGYKRGGEWQIKRTPGEISIETSKKGPRRVEIWLPESFNGAMEFVNVSGEVNFEGTSPFTRLKVTNVSGIVSLQDLPSEHLEVSTVSGNVLAAQLQNRPAPQVEMQSVSGDVDLKLRDTFPKLHFGSVSGSVFLQVPESTNFQYRLESVSGAFSGFPEDAEESRDFGERDLEGKVGEASEASIHFETISGEFQLMRDQIAL